MGLDASERDSARSHLRILWQRDKEISVKVDQMICFPINSYSENEIVALLVLKEHLYNIIIYAIYLPLPTHHQEMLNIVEFDHMRVLSELDF